jgi:hypothetical protein
MVMDSEQMHQHIVKRGKVYGDLEGDIVDVASSVWIVSELFETSLLNSEIKDLKTGFRTLVLTDEQINGMSFALTQMQGFSRALYKKYFEAFERPPEAGQVGNAG